MYRSIADVPDLRLPGDSWIDHDADSELARCLSAQNLPLDQLVRAVFAARADWDERRIALRTRQVLDLPKGMAGDVAGWLSDSLGRPPRPFLDVGCGSGGLLAAAAKAGRQGIGIDVSMTWLVVAKRMIEHHGGRPMLAAALAEHLPLANRSVSAAISLDVIEHVRDQRGYVDEIARIVEPGGTIAIATPNRFSLTPEPHVFVWGVGWLPRKFQKAYVRLRSGKSYDDTVLLSSFGLSKLLKKREIGKLRIDVPEIPPHHIGQFSYLKANTARVYNHIRKIGVLRPFFLMFAPFFQVQATTSLSSTGHVPASRQHHSPDRRPRPNLAGSQHHVGPSRSPRRTR